VVILAILMQIIFGKIREITKRKNTFKKKQNLFNTCRS
jgi:hypothetical protein